MDDEPAPNFREMGEDFLDRAIITAALLLFEGMLFKSKYSSAVQSKLKERIAVLLERYSVFDLKRRQDSTRP
jgi:hypothetical protein